MFIEMKVFYYFAHCYYLKCNQRPGPISDLRSLNKLPLPYRYELYVKIAWHSDQKPHAPYFILITLCIYFVYINLYLCGQETLIRPKPNKQRVNIRANRTNEWQKDREKDLLYQKMERKKWGRKESVNKFG